MSLMVKIDKYVGIPLCFLLSVFHSLNKFLGFVKDDTNRQIRKAVFIELSEMGSTVLAYSAIKKFKQFYPNTEAYFLIFKELEVSLKAFGYLPEKNILTIRSKNFFLLTWDTIKFISWARRNNVDVIIDLELFSRFTSLITYLSGAPTRVGFYNFNMEGLYRGDFLTHKITYNTNHHLGVGFLSMVYALKAPKEEYPLGKRHISEDELETPPVFTSQKAKQDLWKKLKEKNIKINEKSKIVIVSPTTKLLTLRKWPLTHYISLIRKMLKDENVYVVLEKTPSKLAVSEIKGELNALRSNDEVSFIIETIKNERCFAVELTLRELIDFGNIADLFISNDGGATNFISASKVPIVAFFGPTPLKEYKPIGKKVTVLYSDFACSPCIGTFNHKLSVCSNNVCLQVIKPEEAYKAVRKYLYNEA
ncbi:MAG TPA: glycosyltransferase family 9 protein [Candidatus Nanoarchaeia archaeon]|nr:glycosyltransferase family 9 protein [Candidatus Nanoarchaeia archaeon]